MDGRFLLTLYGLTKEHIELLRYFKWITLLLLFVLVICMYNQKKAIIHAGLSAITCWLINAIIHMYIYIPRPFVRYGIEPLIKHSANASFPSDHAAVSFAIAVSLMFYNKKIGIIAVLTACTICLIRITAGLHYPIDTVIGAGIGTISAILLWILLRGYKNE